MTCATCEPVFVPAEATDAELKEAIQNNTAEVLALMEKGLRKMVV